MRKTLSSRTVLFLQVTEPGFYPPIINATLMFAEEGWNVVVLSSPSVDTRELTLTPHDRIQVVALSERPSNVVSKKAIATYCIRAVEVARRTMPSLIYASDPLGGLAGVLAKQAVRSKMIYHEHDSPSAPVVSRPIQWSRSLATKAADFVVFPNGERAAIAQKSLGFDPSKIFVLWNLPRRAEVPVEQPCKGNPAIVYYHGNISPNRLFETFFIAASAMSDRIRISIVGYEAPSAKGYMNHVLDKWGSKLSIKYYGSQSRATLLTASSEADIGLALHPMDSTNPNFVHLLGASVKSFDYMACGLALLISDLPGWNAMFVEPGYALACDPRSVESVEASLRTLVASPQLRYEMGKRARTRILEEWNYEGAWSKLKQALSL